MKHFLWSLVLVFLAAAPAWSSPNFVPINRPPSTSGGTLLFLTGDTADSQAIGVSGFCTVRFEQSSGDDVSLYAVTSSSTAASSGTLLKAFTSSTSPSNPAYTFTASTQWVKAVAVDATTGGSRLIIECNPTFGSSGGSKADVDGDGLYEVAYLEDYDADGSTFVTCTGAATPDIACWTEGEVINRDVIDDSNAVIHGTGPGGERMESDGVLILQGGVVHVGFPCWNASSPGNHTPENAEISDANHDDEATTDCAVDGDGNALTVLSMQDWQGTLMGEGFDTRDLHRGLASATSRRDKGSYFLSDFGPNHDTPGSANFENKWFSSTTDMIRMVSAGFTTNTTNTAHQLGSTAGDGDSKGWWMVYADAAWDVGTSNICLRDSGGTAGTTYKTASTVSDLTRGDILLVPIKTNTNSTTYSYYEVRVRDTPSVACGTSNLGLRVPLGGSLVSVADASRVYPSYAGVTTATDNVQAIHARSEYSNTNVTITNMTLGPLDSYNEIGGRCTNDTSNDSVANGTAFRAALTDSGTLFTNAVDNANIDFSCDTNPLVGFWGGGKITLGDVAITRWHFYAVDGGSGGGTHTMSNVRWLYGNGGPAFDSGNGWQLFNSKIENSSFDSYVISVLGAGFLARDLVIRNSVFAAIAGFTSIQEGSRFENIRTESSQFDYLFGLGCGANRMTFRDLYITGRGYTTKGGIPAGLSLDCSTTTNPITANVIDGFVIDPPDVNSGGNAIAAAVLMNATSGNSAAIYGNSFSRVRAAVNSDGTDGLEGCIFGAYDFAPGGAPDDAGESILFTNNFFSHSSIPVNGRVFCVQSSSGAIAVTDSDAGTPAWGDPVGCGNMDGGAVYADENCI